MYSGTDQDLLFLNINQAISAVCAGHLDSDSNLDTLVVGTQTNVLAYDIQNNSDLFYKDVCDGLVCLVVLKMLLGYDCLKACSINDISFQVCFCYSDYI